MIPVKPIAGGVAHALAFLLLAGAAATDPVAPVAEAALDTPVRGSPAWREREALRVKEWRRQQRTAGRK